MGEPDIRLESLGEAAVSDDGTEAWLAVRGSPYAWVAASLLMFLGPPRVVLSYLAFLLVGYQLAASESHDRAVAQRNSQRA